MTPRADYDLPVQLRPGEIIVDSFAGGGGASLGIQWALGRSPDIAINHDAEAVALHAANHPESTHFTEDVWRVDPVQACRGRPVGLMWLSPDCKHFSKAKGGKPVNKKIRGLAWVAVRWATAVRPRIIVLENVEEFQGWGPVLKTTGKPCPARKGRTFRAFIRKLERLGYAVQWRELRACDFGAPTIRKRLFLIARCDGERIVWPVPTHGKGRAQPWRTAAECIDWSLPCPSIFLSRADATALWREEGIKINRPLADKTLRRIARGIQRFVIESPQPFIVTYYGPTSEHGHRVADVNEPLRTQGAENRFGLVIPHITKFRDGSSGSSMDEPMPTVTANGFVKRPGGAPPLGVVAPYLVPTAHAGDERAHSLEEPIRTVTGGRRGDHALVAPMMIPRYGEWPDHPARGNRVDVPMPTVVPTQNGAQLVSAFLAKHYGDTGQRPGSALDEPVATVTACDHNALVTAHLQRDFGKSVGSDLAAPIGTVTGGGGGHAAVVASQLVKLKGTARDGQQLALPLHTVNAGGQHHGVVASHLVKLSENSVGQQASEPLHTVMPGATRFAEVRAFLMAYYGNDRVLGSSPADPLRTQTDHARFALVTVDGADYVIADIGMRMLQPRELYRAHRFPDSYVIDVRYRDPKTGRLKWLSKTAQVKMVGNSVPPDLPAAIVAANLRGASKELVA